MKIQFVKRDLRSYAERLNDDELRLYFSAWASKLDREFKEDARGNKKDSDRNLR
jgi:hypothetical protein